eukprot:2266135-Rhodomonas_salina.1
MAKVHAARKRERDQRCGLRHRNHRPVHVLPAVPAPVREGACRRVKLARARQIHLCAIPLNTVSRLIPFSECCPHSPVANRDTGLGAEAGERGGVGMYGDDGSPAVEEEEEEEGDDRLEDK